VLLKSSTDDRIIFGRVSIRAITGDEPGQRIYAILECRACEEHFVAERRAGEWIAVYPIAHRPVAEEISEPIKSEFEEVHLCFAVRAHRACLSMCQTALEALWRNKGVSGLNELRDKGTISSSLFDQATEVRLWANVAKHKLIHEPIEREDAEQLLGYLEAILHTVYVEPARFAALKQKREQKLGKAASQQ
jgi:hypothetical protein